MIKTVAATSWQADCSSDPSHALPSHHQSQSLARPRDEPKGEKTDIRVRHELADRRDIEELDDFSV